MKFTVADLRSLSKGIRWLSARERSALSAMLHRRQPDFFEVIGEVGRRPTLRGGTGVLEEAFRQSEMRRRAERW
jgi:hypothetical protein